VELKRIGGKESESVETLSTDIARCLFPDADVENPDESGLFDLLQYSVSELANNVCQHAKAAGYAMAQYNGSTDLIRVAIADCGIGIGRSFAENGSPRWNKTMGDLDAVKLALQPKVSSKDHLSTPWGGSVNAGVGLTLLEALSRETGGQFFLASGTAGLFRKGADVQAMKELTDVGHFGGTVCALSVTRSSIRNFPEVLQRAKLSTGLLQPTDHLRSFFP
jgi:hypothetical protein